MGRGLTAVVHFPCTNGCHVEVYWNIINTIISVLAKGRSFTANSGTKTTILPKWRSSIANSGILLAVLLRMNVCNSFQLLSTVHSLFSIWINLKRSQRSPTRWWGEWIWITEPSGFHRNSPQGLNISSIRVFDQIRDTEIPINLRPLLEHKIKNPSFHSL